MTVINRLSTRRRGEEVVERIPDWMPRNPSDWIAMGFMLCISLLTLMPIVWLLATSLRTPAESFTVPPEWIPRDLFFGNYLQVFDEIPFVYQMGNSFFVTLSTVLGQLTTATLAGYTFARLYFPGRDALFWIVLATLMIPYQATLIPLFIIISKVFGLADTLWSLILPALPTAFGTFLLRQYFLQIPVEYEEAAMMDGANAWQRFWDVTIPQLRSVLVIVILLRSIWDFKEFDLIYLMTGGGPVIGTQTLPLMVYKQAFPLYDMGKASTVAVAMLAVMLVFMFFYFKTYGRQEEDV
jgi:multiple sugar transport system permease protein